MRYLKWAFWGIIAIIAAAFFHYTLPQHDIVRITDTFEKRVDFGANSIFWADANTGNATGNTNRDVFFIQSIRENGKPMVYRNEDTGWGWPPYFKFDTNNLQAQASDLKSTSANPQWVRVTHYGWRNEFLSTFPNAVGLKAVPGPDVTSIPWLNIIILTLVAALFWAIRVRWLRFRRRRIDPMLENVEDSYDRSRFARWRADRNANRRGDQNGGTRGT
ncbi:DUF1523 family protein [Pseudooceanicola sediminis]|uniref:DUF1523 family protein n=1 Tax=Pseudooceanicola sediminis TaxID=2211117 RepID=A0A399IZA2_9RHOB|nr:DUF1523 family protein [Pseudooceanicola sediminis]KAA2313438.1 DUF1523 family protein [Puniceibacterium sp. HSS470]RII38284.1 DUF1523 family protein [Pseudooceanicola sediminis]|tara:strand:- start:22819 stop:23472 length:654 start_codon:yes stop_codon:yes gene_type:complete